eukprot:6170239-Pyramimonas_sp.AAC.1
MRPWAESASTNISTPSSKPVSTNDQMMPEAFSAKLENRALGNGCSTRGSSLALRIMAVFKNPNSHN